MHGKEPFPFSPFPLQVLALPHWKIAKIAILLGMGRKEKGWDNTSCLSLAIEVEGGKPRLEVADVKRERDRGHSGTVLGREGALGNHLGLRAFQGRCEKSSPP